MNWIVAQHTSRYFDGVSWLFSHHKLLGGDKNLPSQFSDSVEKKCVLDTSLVLTPLWSWHIFGLDLLADTRWPITRGSIWCSILRIQENFNIQTNHTLAAISCFCLSTFCLGGLTLMHTLCVVDAQVPWTNCVTYFLLSVPVHTHVGTCTHTHTTCQK